MQKYWICAVLLAFVFGIAIDRVVQRRTLSLDRDSALAGIEKLHRLDERVTLLRDPKALQEVWTDDAVRIYAGDVPVNVGKQAIYATDVGTIAPGSAITSYKTDVRDVRVVDDDWAVEWGVIEASFRQAADKPAVPIHGKSLRILHRESNGDWKFSRIMYYVNSDQPSPAPPKK
jgi:uncharacterized protein (TIGR02246 family)